MAARDHCLKEIHINICNLKLKCKQDNHSHIILPWWGDALTLVESFATASVSTLEPGLCDSSVTVMGYPHYIHEAKKEMVCSSKLKQWKGHQEYCPFHRDPSVSLALSLARLDWEAQPLLGVWWKDCVTRQSFQYKHQAIWRLSRKWSVCSEQFDFCFNVGSTHWIHQNVIL